MEGCKEGSFTYTGRKLVARGRVMKLVEGFELVDGVLVLRFQVKESDLARLNIVWGGRNRAEADLKWWLASRNGFACRIFLSPTFMCNDD